MFFTINEAGYTDLPGGDTASIGLLIYAVSHGESDHVPTISKHQAPHQVEANTQTNNAFANPSPPCLLEIPQHGCTIAFDRYVT